MAKILQKARRRRMTRWKEPQRPLAIFKIVAVKVRKTNNQKTVSTYALLDSGSTITFCSEDLLKLHRLCGKKEDPRHLGDQE